MNQEKFTRLMIMTTSSFDGEALNAIRMANAMLAEHNFNWEDFISGKMQAKAIPQPRPRSRRMDQHGEDANLIEEAKESVNQKASFYKVIESISNWFDDKGFITDRQREVLQRAVEEARKRRYR